MMRRVFLLVGFLMLAVLGACAGLEAPPDNPDPPPRTKSISMGLMTDAFDFAPERVEGGSLGGGVAWELTVDPQEIVGGEPFLATFEGKAIFDERFLSFGLNLELVPGGFKDILIADLLATVHVRKGVATGGDVELTADTQEAPYRCARTKTPCDPDNDILPGAPGLRGNTDCEPPAPNNPCGQLVEIPTSNDCAKDGVCDDLGHTGPDSLCDKYKFCVSGPLEVTLTGRPEEYEAEDSGTVLFGYDDGPDTGFSILEEDGCNVGIWIWYRDELEFTDPVGPNGVRIMLGGVAPVAIEYVMGEESRGDEGIDSCDAHSSRSPDSSLIKFPIQEP